MSKKKGGSRKKTYRGSGPDERVYVLRARMTETRASQSRLSCIRLANKAGSGVERGYLQREGKSSISVLNSERSSRSRAA